MARRYRKKPLPPSPGPVALTSLSHDGRGVTHIDGKAVFIDQGLAGETVKFVYTLNKRDYAEGRVTEVLTPAADRVAPKCAHYPLCGGCSLQHLAMPAQIHHHQNMLNEQFVRLGKLEPPPLWPPLDGPHWGYRRKARLGVKYVPAKGRVLVGFRERGQSYLADMSTCEVLDARVGGKLMALSELFGQLSIKAKIPQLEVAIGDTETVLAIRVLSPPTDEDCQLLSAFSREHGMTFYLQPKGPASIHALPGETPPLPSYHLPAYDLTLHYKPAMFTQVNADINRAMIDQALAALQLETSDTVLDLFCGLGNFTLPLARHAGHVVGVEGDTPLVDQARANAIANDLDNATFHVADLSRNLDDQPWAQRRYDKVLLDPSRAGASEVLPWLKTWQPRRVVYVSCNPATLARDAGILVHELGYKLVKAGIMNMFPHTAHVESMALFTRR
ncbi:MAG: 23S rRNA (uracil(1939)-C(5))-methyltransferase RlmD [Methylococcales bacterium]|nr:23S rRNA (uracil(1939)-C(5))-methyltransferase RlmD [Methylococcales bacterium]